MKGLLLGLDGLLSTISTPVSNLPSFLVIERNCLIFGIEWNIWSQFVVRNARGNFNFWPKRLTIA